MRPPPPNEITRLLLRWSRGDRSALDQLMPVVYDELYRLAHSYLRRERPDHTLQPTALINEAYLRLIRQDSPEWQSRRHFYGVAAQLMRQILVEYARARGGQRGGGDQKFSLDEALTFSDGKASEQVALDDALVALAKFDGRKVRIIELRYFGGLSLEETAAALGLSIATIGHETRLARVAAPRNGALTAMNPVRWRRIEELFRTMVDRPADERDAYLTGACGADEDLRREALSLIERDTAEDFIRGPIANAALVFTAKAQNDLTGKRIGAYRVTRLIGRGGMGVVYEAERDDEQFRRQVAIKIIKRGMDTDFVRDRFLRERQILASLDHPHIARMFDGGAMADGSPYFVMEFVAGEPITAYCRRRRLSVSEKLKLFLKVCSAVQHARQRLVIHRDLKPSNILITPRRRQGRRTKAARFRHRQIAFA